MRRAVKIVYNDGSEPTYLELSKATSIRGDARMLHFDRLDDGTWRLIFSTDVATDFTKIQSFEMVRED